MSTTQPSLPPEIITPIINAYAHSIRPAFSFILISAVFSAILIPLLLMFFVLSTPHSRRQPIFILNVFTITLGIVVGVLSNHLTMSSILSPFKGIDPTEDLVYNILYIWLPWITEAVLILRVIIVYSPGYTSVLRIVSILAFSIIIKAVRAAVNIVFLVQWHKSTSSSGNVNQFSTTTGLNTWMAKTAWILELVDNLYISGLFLWRLASQGNLFNSQSVGRVTGKEGSGVSFTSRLKSLFWIAATNLIFPLIFNLVQIVIVFTSDDILLAASIEMVNIYVAIISTAFATIWAATTSFKEAHQNIYNQGNSQVTEMKIEPMAFSSQRSGSETLAVKSWVGQTSTQESSGEVPTV
ncbi:hypothetical protein VKT23_002566 [Stygiomarasmius scandens]|uniref:Uncharacterized protein n=1 Tax=Marasmiellus scandens TaxID=2682957 RepID=A0ABR1K5Z0_9AGAR